MDSNGLADDILADDRRAARSAAVLPTESNESEPS